MNRNEESSLPGITTDPDPGPILTIIHSGFTGNTTRLESIKLNAGLRGPGPAQASSSKTRRITGTDESASGW